MDEDVFEAYLLTKKNNYLALIEAERKAEEERQAQLKAEQERIEAQRVENERLKAEAEAREKEMEAERKRVEAEREKERKEAEAKQKAIEDQARIEREKAEAIQKAEEEKVFKAIKNRQNEAGKFLIDNGFHESSDHGGMYWLHSPKENRSSETLLLHYRKDRLCFESDESLETFKSSVLSEIKAKALEAELQAKRDAEIKAEQDRQQAELKAKAEADKLAKAPIKKQLSKWVESFSIEIPSSELLNNELALDIKDKFEAFKKWSQSQINNL
jgi:membrane protein involved in colicin uptake